MHNNNSQYGRNWGCQLPGINYLLHSVLEASCSAYQALAWKSDQAQWDVFDWHFYENSAVNSRWHCMYRFNSSSLTTDSWANIRDKNRTLPNNERKKQTKKKTQTWPKPITTLPYHRWSCIMQPILHNEMWNTLIPAVLWSKWISFVPTVIQSSGCTVTCPTQPCLQWLSWARWIWYL